MISQPNFSIAVRISLLRCAAALFWRRIGCDRKFGWEIMAHPPTSPDLAPCDSFLFPRIKEIMLGQRFKDAEAINESYKPSLFAVTKSDLHPGIDGLVHCREKCIDADGQHFESL